VIGTLGLLLRAKKNGMIPSVKPLIAKMLDNGIWIKSEIVDGILRDASEDVKLKP
jgi:predicted nucleic acid-binding protein